jgi:hypothetical protein
MMRRLKTYRIFISLAALLFVAKPFLGFTVINRHLHPRQIHTILVKSFSKRKPEVDATEHLERIRHLLNNPLGNPLSAITVLLLALFPFIFRSFSKLTQSVISDIYHNTNRPVPVYLFSGKLTI